MMRLSVITPAFNEEKNLPVFHDRLCAALKDLPGEWEWIVVDDHSSDRTFEVLKQLSERDARVRGERLARNIGSHLALVCGLERAKGDCAVVMAADLQDPPETLPELVEKWRRGSQVVWAVRAGRAGERARTRAFARAYYWLMRNIAGLKNMPETGADFFLVDRRVIDSLVRFREANASVLALLTWMGFRQDRILYTKEARLHGRSGWSLGKKVKLVIDSITSFSYLPIRVVSIMGFIVALLGFLYAVLVIVNPLAGRWISGSSSIMVVVVVMGGIQMMIMGILGEYLWRALDESRRRPRFIIEDETRPAGDETREANRP
jgi:dolichol-phosphate mannosyltransferase